MASSGGPFKLGSDTQTMGSSMLSIPRRLSVEPRLTLTTAELHLLDCVDGSLGAEDLAFICGRSVAEVAQMLARLVEAKVVSFEAKAPIPVLSAAPKFGDEIELALTFRAEIDSISARLESEDSYQLLGVARGATKEDIRAAYYRLAPRFHPDRHFRKKLGHYKQKIEGIFAKLTKAHDTLRSDELRRLYDATLLRSSRSVSPAAPAAPPIAAVAAPSGFPRASVRPAVGTGTPSGSVPPFAVAQETEEQRHLRRDALARKMSRIPQSAPGTASSRAPAASRSDDPPDSTPSAPSCAADAGAPAYEKVKGVRSSDAEIFRERFEGVGNEVRDRRLARYLATGEDAVNLGDYRTAAAAYAQALKLAPENQEIALRAKQMANLAGIP